MRWAWGAFFCWGGGWVGCDEIAGHSGGGLPGKPASASGEGKRDERGWREQRGERAEDDGGNKEDERAEGAGGVD